MLTENLSSFLTLGYFLDYRNPSIRIEIGNVDKQRYAGVSEQDLIQRGAALWREAIAVNFELGQRHLVPLSGGLDSRAILAGLLEHTEAASIDTYTFGTPGTLDVDIGSLIAKKLGTNHTTFDLTRHVYKQEELEDISCRVDRQTVLFHHWPVWEVDHRYRGCFTWSGFLGETLSGSHRPKRPSATPAAATAAFVDKNRFVRSIALSPLAVDFTQLIDTSLVDGQRLTLEEQLDLRNRQTKYIAPLVLMRGCDYRTPFLHQPWIDFILSVPDCYRIQQTLYKHMLLHAFPAAFAYKTKTNNGLPLKASKCQVMAWRAIGKIQNFLGIQHLLGRPAPGINYLDFARAIRQKPDLHHIVTTNVMDLHHRRLIDWLDISKILANHLNGSANHADALLVLASLEIHLKAGKTL